uniref:Uncharacterized protein n=1 Tax=Arundo donax TaxID=35708 RepID=A0A0A9ANT7_ARUDO
MHLVRLNWLTQISIGSLFTCQKMENRIRPAWVTHITRFPSSQALV